MTLDILELLMQIFKIDQLIYGRCRCKLTSLFVIITQQSSIFRSTDYSVLCHDKSDNVLHMIKSKP